MCHADIHPCTGCVACGYEGPCVQKDDVQKIREKMLSSDMVVFFSGSSDHQSYEFRDHIQLCLQSEHAAAALGQMILGSSQKRSTDLELH